jgi:hypothetical protein
MIQIANVVAATAAAAQATITATAAGDYTPSVTVTSLTAAAGSPTARIAVEDSPDGTTWTTVCQFEFSGQIGSGGASVTQSQRIRTADNIGPHVRAHLVSLNDTISFTVSI